MTIVHVGVKGSSKSGNFGHAGRPGKLGGSSPKPGLSLGVDLKVVERRQIDSGINSADVVTLADGSVWIEKTNSGKDLGGDSSDRDFVQYQAQAEVLAYEIGPLLGAIVPETYIVKGNTTRQRFVDGQTALEAALDKQEAIDIIKTREGLGMTVLDYVTGNVDRRSCNWMINKAGKPVAIDNGLSHPGPMSFMLINMRDRITYKTWMERPLPQDVIDNLHKIADNPKYPSGYRARAKFAAELGKLPGELPYQVLKDSGI